jgi:dihydropteroate synthase
MKSRAMNNCSISPLAVDASSIAGMVQLSISQKLNPPQLADLDDQLSNRFIELDPGGYFLIYLDTDNGLICAKHFSNVINDKGLACDPETGEPLPCNGGVSRQPTQLYTGRTAKELCIAIFESSDRPCPVTMMDHAAYLGREFVRAELALLSGQEYVQD